MTKSYAPLEMPEDFSKKIHDSIALIDVGYRSDGKVLPDHLRWLFEQARNLEAFTKATVNFVNAADAHVANLTEAVEVKDEEIRSLKEELERKENDILALLQEIAEELTDLAEETKAPSNA